MSKQSVAEKAEAVAKLREWIKPGDTVYTVLRRVSRSGMQREIGVVLMRDGQDFHPNYSVAKALGERTGKRDGVIVSGCGMDMGFDLVYRLGFALFGHGEACAKLGYMTGRNGDRGPETDGGYLLRGGSNDPRAAHAGKQARAVIAAATGDNHTHKGN